MTATPHPTEKETTMATTDVREDLRAVIRPWLTCEAPCGHDDDHGSAEVADEILEQFHLIPR